jgi:hypothetical protein
LIALRTRTRAETRTSGLSTNAIGLAGPPSAADRNASQSASVAADATIAARFTRRPVSRVTESPVCVSSVVASRVGATRGTSASASTATGRNATADSFEHNAQK